MDVGLRGHSLDETFAWALWCNEARAETEIDEGC